MSYPEWDGMPSCRGTDTEMWFSDDDKPRVYKEQQLLQRICNGCEVKAQCLQYALENTVEGYWAGTTPRARQQMRTKLRIHSNPVGLAWGILKS